MSGSKIKSDTQNRQKHSSNELVPFEIAGAGTFDA